MRVAASNVIGQGDYSIPNTAGITVRTAPRFMWPATRGSLTSDAQLIVNWAQISTGE